jgi:hypothetical protein
MRGTKTAFGLAVVAAAVYSGSASGAARPGSYYFHDCIGPTGTPASFTAVKENTPSPNGASAAVAFRLTDGRGVFVAHAFDGVIIGKGIPQDQLTTTCLVDFASPEETLPVSGFIAGP